MHNPWPIPEFLCTTYKDVLIQIGDSVKHKKTGSVGSIVSFYIGGQDDVIAWIMPLELKPDPDDSHADCLMCQSWCTTLDEIEIVD